MLSASAIKLRFKKSVRYFISGHESKFFEDEIIGFSLKKLIPSLEIIDNSPRLNIITPTLSMRDAFGGVSTLIEFPLQVFFAGLSGSGWRVRIICLGSRPSDNDNLGKKFIQRIGINPDHVVFHYNSMSGTPVPVGVADVFIGSLWFHFFSILPVLMFQKKINNGLATPYVGFFQDYEASFNPWSSAYMLAQAMYDSDWPKVHIFNSQELASFFVDQGHHVSTQISFEPVMNVSLRKALISSPIRNKMRQLIFYGRPDTRRNCYYLTREALNEWSEAFVNSRQWQVVSVGQEYPSFTLPNGCRVDVKGKLSLEEYSQQLRHSAVGFSLMASPHPSYPPLEMAHFGALTVTNSFPSKNLTNWHENIITVDRCTPSHIAAALAEACARFEQDIECGLRGKSLKPSYLDSYDTQVLTKCAKIIQDCVVA